MFFLSLTGRQLLFICTALRSSEILLPALEIPESKSTGSQFNVSSSDICSNTKRSHFADIRFSIKHRLFDD